MIERISSLLVALAVAAAPVTFEACAIACASPMHQEAAHAGHGHSCHDGAARVHVSPQPHACDHSGDLPGTPSVAAIRDTHDAIDFPLVLPANAAVGFVTSIELARTPASFRQPAWFDVPLAIPLRV